MAILLDDILTAPFKGLLGIFKAIAEQIEKEQQAEQDVRRQLLSLELPTDWENAAREPASEPKQLPISKPEPAGGKERLAAGQP